MKIRNTWAVERVDASGRGRQIRRQALNDPSDPVFAEPSRTDAAKVAGVGTGRVSHQYGLALLLKGV